MTVRGLARCGWLLLVVFLVLFPAAAHAQTEQTVVVGLDGAVSPVSATHLLDALNTAERNDAAALIVEIDTPGGLDASMREVIQAFLSADVPVIAYVTPSGARAASAGALIAMSAHVAAMAPGTTIGAATPVDMEGGELSDKVVNDAAAYAEAIADQRGRNAEFAIEAVRDGRSVTAESALQLGAVDLIAPTREDLLAELEGTTVTLEDGRQETLQLAGTAVSEQSPSVVRELMLRLVDPNIAFVLLSLGTLAILVEFANPGIGAGGITGVLLLVVAFFSLSVLPTSIVGVLFIILAAALFIGELFVPGTGVMAAGGAVSLALAGLFLFERASGLGVSLALVLPTSIIVFAAATAAAVAVRRAHTRPAHSGDEVMMNRVVQVQGAQGDQGQVMINGELWHARTVEPPLEDGMWVRILEREGLTLLVEPEEE